MVEFVLSIIDNSPQKVLQLSKKKKRDKQCQNNKCIYSLNQTLSHCYMLHVMHGQK